MGHTNLTITPTLVADQVFEVLRSQILTGELTAGFPLRVRDVAAMVGTSVMPVREAISRLEEAGLATRVPHKGAVVREFSVSELIHIYDVRTILEVQAARRGAGRVTDEDLATMQAACERMLQAVTDERFSDALDDDEVIHRTLYNAGRNPVLTSVIETLWVQCRPYKVMGATEAIANNDSSLWTTQQAIVNAARDHDAETASAIIAESLASALRRLEHRLIPSDTSERQVETFAADSY